MPDTPLPLLATLGYTVFRDPALLEAALTHRSAGRKHNERLEFLGDSVVNFVVGAALYRDKPKLNEGQLTRQRAALVRRETLAEISREIRLGDYLVLGGGEMKSGGHTRESILADGFEAIVGAIYLDGGFTAAEQVVLKLFAQRLHDLPDASMLKDPKTRLQEWLQGKGLALPEYRLKATTGQSHIQQFTVACVVATLGVEAKGQGSSKRRAEQASAEAMLLKLHNENA